MATGAPLIRRLGFVLAASLVGPLAVAAQSDASALAECDGRVVTEIVIDPRGPSLGQLADRWSALHWFERNHVTTTQKAIGRFLMLAVGEPCTELRRTESERILRSQPFIADAHVRALPEGRDGVRIEVVTIDEFSIIASAGFSTKAPLVRRARLGDANLLGKAMSLSMDWRLAPVLRDEFTARVTHNLFLGQRSVIEIQGARRTLGSAWSVAAQEPFISDLQRTAWRTSFANEHYYFRYAHPDRDGLVTSGERIFADIGGVVRIGEPGRLSLFGASLTAERQRISDVPLVVTDSSVTIDTTAALTGRFSDHRSSRVNALYGVRNLQFMRVSGFDALSAAQDVRKGFQLGVLAGRSLQVLGSRDDDMFLSGDLYAGYGTPRAFTGLQVVGEGRQDFDTGRWDGILFSGRLATYLRPFERHTLILSAEYSGGWRQRAPFQLRLGDADAGVRGFSDSRAAGAARQVARVEYRWYTTSFGRAVDMGLAVFGDAGRVRAGDVPFGVDTPTEVGLGLGILAAIPAGSKHLWRLDIAFPVTHDDHAGISVRLSGADFTRLFWQEPADVMRSRESFVPSRLFRWP